jgi:hypothetical protein
MLKCFEDVPEKLCNINANMSSQKRDVGFPWSTLWTWLLSGAWRLASRQTGISQITQRNIRSSGMSLLFHKVTGYRRFETNSWSFFFLDIMSLEEETSTWLDTSGTQHPGTQRHIAEELTPQLQSCENLKTIKLHARTHTHTHTNRQFPEALLQDLF